MDSKEKGLIQFVLTLTVAIVSIVGIAIGVYFYKYQNSVGKKIEQVNDLSVTNSIPTLVPVSFVTIQPKPANTPTKSKQIADGTVDGNTTSFEKCPNETTIACVPGSPLCKDFASPCDVPKGWDVVHKIK